MTARRKSTSPRHFGSKPGDLNIPIYVAPSPEASTLLVTAYRYNGLPIPIGKRRQVVPGLVELEVAVPRSRPAVW